MELQEIKSKLSSRPEKVRQIKYSSNFTNKYQKLIKKNLTTTVKAIDSTIEKLSKFQITNQQHNHQLNGNLKGWWDVHAAPNVVIIYKYVRDELYIDLELKDIADHDFGLSKNRK